VEEVRDVELIVTRVEAILTRSADLYNMYLTEVQNEPNVVIKKLTSISFIFLPITAIASLYAVNFPSIQSSFSDISALIFTLPLIALGIILTVYLRKINWL
jgi:Mg2+ and Co2+ transporter CorA